MKIDLHCHSEASYDCRTPVTAFPDLCRERGIRVQALTDHDQVWGAQRLQELVARRGLDLTVIVGQEVSTREGELIGLFLTEKVPRFRPALETAEAIHAQGGLVLLPHGFDPLKFSRLRPRSRERLAESLDVIEGFNARVSRRSWNRAAVAWAAARGLPVSAGTDAHRAADVGCAWVDVPDREIRGPADLLAALEGAVPEGTWTHPALAVARFLRAFVLRR